MESLTQSINREIAERLETDDEFRREYIRAWAGNDVASELRRMRSLRRKNQTQLAKLVKTGQSAISRIEKATYDGWSYKTLTSIAIALNARLRIRFEPIETVINDYRGMGTSVEPILETSDGTGSETSSEEDVVSVSPVPLIGFPATSTSFMYRQ